MCWKLEKLVEWADRQKQLYEELEKYPVTWQEVLHGEKKVEWLFGELYYFIKLIEEVKKGESMKKYTKNEIWELIINYCIATEEELQLITDINGYSEKTLNDVIYARIGYQDIEQYEDSET